MSELINRVVDFLKKYELQDKTIIVGFSGGYDSMCLLDVLAKIRQMDEFWDLKIVAAHFNHNWRGEEALREQEVCRLFSSSRGFEFFTKTAPIGLKKNENEARLARYEFFEEAVENYDADAVFTAHNKDDNAETVLYRVIKGTGLYGLRGIAQKRDYFYRPLLQTTRSEIVDYCEENNLIPNIDSSNADITYKRNYLRLNIIPSLEKVNIQAKDALSSLATVAESENAIIEEYISLLKSRVCVDDRIISSEFKKLSKPVKQRFIYDCVQGFGIDYDYKRICEIYDFIEKNIDKRNGSTISLATAKWLYVDDKYIEVIPKDSASQPSILDVLIEGEGEYYFGNKTFIIKKYVHENVFVFPESTANFAYVDLSKIKYPLKFRNRNEGDVINPFGMIGTMKLKKYLNSKGVNRHKRDDLMLLANDDEVLWVVGVGLSNKISVSRTPTHVIEVV